MSIAGDKITISKTFWSLLPLGVSNIMNFNKRSKTLWGNLNLLQLVKFNYLMFCWIGIFCDMKYVILHHFFYPFMPLAGSKIKFLKSFKNFYTHLERTSASVYQISWLLYILLCIQVSRGWNSWTSYFPWNKHEC